MSLLTPTIHTETVELIKVAVQQRISNGLWRARVDAFEDYTADQLVLALQAHVYGRTGKHVTETRRVSVPKFPRYLPRWLKARWTRVREITLDVTPMIVWPDATFAPPEFGQHIQIVSTSVRDRTAEHTYRNRTNTQGAAMRVPPTPKYHKLVTGIGAGVLLLTVVILALTSLFWGWLFMVIVGACGWHIPLVPVAWAIGLGISLLFGARK